MTDEFPNERLDDLLQELGPADPPSDFSRQVLSRLDGDRSRVTGKVVPFGQKGIAMTKKAMWGLAAAAAVILAVFVARGFPTVDRGTEGAIGAAKKYQAGQIASSDVKLGDTSAQEFLQSDTFARLLKDPDAVKALADPAIRAKLSDVEFLRAIRDPELASALRNQVHDAALRPYGPTCGGGGCMYWLWMADAEFQAAVRNPAFFRALGDAEFLRALSDADVSAALRKGDLEAALNNPKLKATMKDPELMAALRGYGPTCSTCAAALKNTNFHDAIRDADFMRSIRDAQFRASLRNQVFAMALGMSHLRGAIASDAFQRAIHSNGFEAAVRNATFAAAMARADNGVARQ